MLRHLEEPAVRHQLPAGLGSQPEYGPVDTLVRRAQVYGPVHVPPAAQLLQVIPRDDAAEAVPHNVHFLGVELIPCLLHLRGKYRRGARDIARLELRQVRLDDVETLDLKP
jgi:hypothetical protein